MNIQKKRLLFNVFSNDRRNLNLPYRVVVPEFKGTSRKGKYSSIYAQFTDGLKLSAFELGRLIASKYVERIGDIEVAEFLSKHCFDDDITAQVPEKITSPGDAARFIDLALQVKCKKENPELYERMMACNQLHTSSLIKIWIILAYYE